MSTNPQIAPGPIADFVASLNPMGIYDHAGLLRAWQKLAPEEFSYKSWPVHQPEEVKQLKTVTYLINHHAPVAYAYEVAMYLCFSLTGVTTEELFRRGPAGSQNGNYSRKRNIWSASVDILERSGL